MSICRESKFILITVIERTIQTAIFSSFKAAHDQMMEEFCKAANVAPEDCTETESECDSEFGYCEWNAYVSDGPNHENYDWIIVDVSD